MAIPSSGHPNAPRPRSLRLEKKSNPSGGAKKTGHAHNSRMFRNPSSTALNCSIADFFFGLSQSRYATVTCPDYLPGRRLKPLGLAMQTSYIKKSLCLTTALCAVFFSFARSTSSAASNPPVRLALFVSSSMITCAKGRQAFWLAPSKHFSSCCCSKPRARPD